MRGRLVGVAIILASLLAGCGSSGGTVHRPPLRTEVYAGNTRVVVLDRFVTRTAGGAHFLVPARLAAGPLDLVRPGSVDVAATPPVPARTTPPGFDAAVTARIDHPYEIEVIASGPAGRRVDVAWEETCGFHRDGRGPGESGGRGGAGQQRARLPAVIAVTLPRWSAGEDSCYVTATLLSDHFQRGLSVELVNHR